MCLYSSQLVVQVQKPKTNLNWTSNIQNLTVKHFPAFLRQPKLILRKLIVPDLALAAAFWQLNYIHMSSFWYVSVQQAEFCRTSLGEVLDVNILFFNLRSDAYAFFQNVSISTNDNLFLCLLCLV